MHTNPVYKIPETRFTLGSSDFIHNLIGNRSDNTFIIKTNGRELYNLDILESIQSILDDNKRDDFYLIKECNIEEDVNGNKILLDSLTKISATFNIIFYKCILPGLIFDGVEINQVILLESLVKSSIQIRNGAINKRLYIGDNSNIGNIKIDNLATCNYISVLNNSQCSGIEFYNGSYSNHISIYDSRICKYVRFYNSALDSITVFKSICGFIGIHNQSYASILSIFSSQIEAIEMTGSILNNLGIQFNSSIDSIYLDHKSICTSMHIANSSVIKALTVKDDNIIESIAIHSSTVNEIIFSETYVNLKLNNAHLVSMKIIACKVNLLEWANGSKGELFIDESKINQIVLSKTCIFKDTVISIVNTSIHIILFQELLILGLLVFRNVTPLETVILWNATNIEDLLINQNHSLIMNHEIEAKKLLEQLKIKYNDGINDINNNYSINKFPLFRIADCSIGKLELTGSNLSDYYFEFRNSKILESFISGTKLPKNIIIYGVKKGDISEYEQKTSIYEQLKRIFESQGNIVEATRYHSLAMKNQGRLLSYLKSNSSDIKLSEKISHWLNLKAFQLNYISNSHGESWPRALLFIISSSILLYTCYYISLFYQYAFSWTALPSFFANYFSFLDPTRRIDFLVDKEELKPISKVLDFLSKVLIGYGIFQFISAFRRHGRKGF